MNLLFWLYKGKSNNSGLAPIYARITVEGVYNQFSTGIRIREHEWVAQGNGYIRGSTDRVKLYNARLSDIRAKIDEIYFDLLRREQAVTPSLIRDRFTGKHKASYSVLEMLTVLIQDQQEDPDLAKGTLKTYYTRANNIRSWLSDRGRKDMRCEELDLAAAKDLMQFLKKPSGHGHSQEYARKNVLVLKKILNKAVELKVIPGNPLLSMRIKKGRAKPIVFLTEEEFALLSGHSFRSRRLLQVRDLFVVQCCTGLSYAELARLSRKHIAVGIDGRDWIHIERQKVAGSQCSIPLMERARQIILKYEYALPVISNGKYNAYLKEVSEVVGIEKNLTTHVGRKTCGMLLLNRDVPIETVSRILGHSSIRITQAAYAQVLDRKVAQDMKGVEF